MAERIELPPHLQGDENAQLQQLWSYLYQMSEAINNNLQAIGGNELTDSDRQVMNKILKETSENVQASGEMETLKSLIIKTADFVQTSLQEYRLNLLGESVASGQFGRYVRHTGLDVAVTPEGITQNYSFEEVVQGLKEFSINAKNYIKTGLLRTVGELPVYGVAIGKDVVTFSEDGTETYNDGNKVAELTAEELSFWQNGVKIAGYTGSRISFYYAGNEVFYIQQGKLYAVGDIEITSGKKLILASGGGLDVNSGGNMNVKSGGKMTVESGGGLDVNSGGNVTVKSGGNLNVNSGGQIDINASGNFKLSGSTVEIKSGSTFNVDSGNILINSNSGVFVTKNYDYASGKDLVFSIGRYTAIEDYKASFYILPYGNNHDGQHIVTYPLSLMIGDDLSVPNEPTAFYMNMGYVYIKNPTDDDNNYGYYPIVEYDARFTNGYIDKPVTIFCDNGRFEYVYSAKYRGTEAYITTVNYSYLIQNSSKEIKHDIQPLPSVGEKLDQLKPVTFVYDDDQNENQRIGFIYEDTVEVMPEICTNDESNKAINYVELIPVLLKEIQELRARVKALEERGENQ